MRMRVLVTILLVVTILHQAIKVNAMAAINKDYVSLTNLGVNANSALVYYTGNAPNRMNCLFQCSAFSVLKGSVCCASTYNSKTLSCVSVMNCTSLLMQGESYATAYVLKDAPYNSMCANTMQVIESDNVTVTEMAATASTDAETIDYGNPFGCTLQFPVAFSWTYPPVAYAYFLNNISTNAIFSIFTSSFTLAFSYRLNISQSTTYPLVSFLGSNSGQLCAHFSLASTCSVEFRYNPTCSCTAPNPYTYNGCSFTNNWQHYAVSYNLTSLKLTLFTNGTLMKTYSNVTFNSTATTISRIMIGGNECNGYDSGLSMFFGSLTCFKVYKLPFTTSQVKNLYDDCS